MDLMGEVQDRLLAEVGNVAKELIDLEARLTEVRARLHAKIREAADEGLGDDKSGPSKIARAAHHRYTREYVGDLLKKTPKE